MPKSLDLLQEFMVDFRQKGEKIILDELAKLTSKMVSFNIDRFYFNTLKELDLVDSPLQKVMQNIDDEYKKIKTTKQRNPSYDFECEISILVPKNTDKILLLLFTEQKKIQDLFETYDFIETYPYWNNTDKPDNISEAEWEQRGKDWNNALPGSGIPSKNGLSFELVGEFLPLIDVNSVLETMPSFKERCQKVAKDKLPSYIEDKETWDLVKSGSIYKFIQEVSKFEKSERGKQIFNQLVEEAEELLPEQITKEILFSNLHEEKMLDELKKTISP
jgi:hypothetical protein